VFILWEKLKHTRVFLSVSALDFVTVWSLVLFAIVCPIHPAVRWSIVYFIFDDKLVPHGRISTQHTTFILKSSFHFSFLRLDRSRAAIGISL